MPWNNLTLPKQPLTDGIPIRPSAPNVPPGGLPSWSRLPYDAKLPLPHCPRNELVLSYTKVGESPYHIHPNRDFELSDPFNKDYPSLNYNSLNDPNLKDFFRNTSHFKRLVRVGKITADGRVKCTLAEYNAYRRYLYKIWGIEVNWLSRTQLREEKMQMESRLAEHLQPVQIQIPHDYRHELRMWEKRLLESSSEKGVLNEKNLLELPDHQMGKSSVLISVADERWKHYQNMLQKRYHENYPDVAKWLNKSTRGYRNVAEKKLEDRKSRERKICEHYNRLREHNLLYIIEEQQVREQENVLQRRLKEKRHRDFQQIWEKNKRKMAENMRRRKSIIQHECDRVDELIKKFRAKRAQALEDFEEQEFKSCWDTKRTIQSTMEILQGDELQAEEYNFPPEFGNKGKEKIYTVHFEEDMLPRARMQENGSICRKGEIKYSEVKEHIKDETEFSDEFEKLNQDFNGTSLLGTDVENVAMTINDLKLAIEEHLRVSVDVDLDTSDEATDKTSVINEDQSFGKIKGEVEPDTKFILDAGQTIQKVLEQVEEVVNVQPIEKFQRHSEVQPQSVKSTLYKVYPSASKTELGEIKSLINASILDLVEKAVGEKQQNTVTNELQQVSPELKSDALKISPKLVLDTWDTIRVLPTPHILGMDIGNENATENQIKSIEIINPAQSNNEVSYMSQEVGENDERLDFEEYAISSTDDEPPPPPPKVENEITKDESKLVKSVSKSELKTDNLIMDTSGAAVKVDSEFTSGNGEKKSLLSVRSEVESAVTYEIRSVVENIVATVEKVNERVAAKDLCNLKNFYNTRIFTIEDELISSPSKVNGESSNKDIKANPSEEEKSERSQNDFNSKSESESQHEAKKHKSEEYIVNFCKCFYFRHLPNGKSVRSTNFSKKNLLNNEVTTSLCALNKHCNQTKSTKVMSNSTQKNDLLKNKGTKIHVFIMPKTKDGLGKISCKYKKESDNVKTTEAVRVSYNRVFPEIKTTLKNKETSCAVKCIDYKFHLTYFWSIHLNENFFRPITFKQNLIPEVWLKYKINELKLLPGKNKTPTALYRAEAATGRVICQSDSTIVSDDVFNKRTEAIKKHVCNSLVKQNIWHFAQKICHSKNYEDYIIFTYGLDKSHKMQDILKMSSSMGITTNEFVSNPSATQMDDDNYRNIEIDSHEDFYSMNYENCITDQPRNGGWTLRTHCKQNSGDFIQLEYMEMALKLLMKKNNIARCKTKDHIEKLNDPYSCTESELSTQERERLLNHINKEITSLPHMNFYQSYLSRKQLKSELTDSETNVNLGESDMREPNIYIPVIKNTDFMHRCFNTLHIDMIDLRLSILHNKTGRTFEEIAEQKLFSKSISEEKFGFNLDFNAVMMPKILHSNVSSIKGLIDYKKLNQEIMHCFLAYPVHTEFSIALKCSKTGKSPVTCDSNKMEKHNEISHSEVIKLPLKSSIPVHHTSNFMKTVDNNGVEVNCRGKISIAMHPNFIHERNIISEHEDAKNTNIQTSDLTQSPTKAEYNECPLKKFGNYSSEKLNEITYFRQSLDESDEISKREETFEYLNTNQQHEFKTNSGQECANINLQPQNADFICSNINSSELIHQKSEDIIPPEANEIERLSPMPKNFKEYMQGKCSIPKTENVSATKENVVIPSKQHKSNRKEKIALPSTTLQHEFKTNLGQECANINLQSQNADFICSNINPSELIQSEDIIPCEAHEIERLSPMPKNFKDYMQGKQSIPKIENFNVTKENVIIPTKQHKSQLNSDLGHLNISLMYENTDLVCSDMSSNEPIYRKSEDMNPSKIEEIQQMSPILKNFKQYIQPEQNFQETKNTCVANKKTLAPAAFQLIFETNSEQGNDNVNLKCQDTNFTSSSRSSNELIGRKSKELIPKDVSELQQFPMPKNSDYPRNKEQSVKKTEHISTTNEKISPPHILQYKFETNSDQDCVNINLQPENVDFICTNMNTKELIHKKAEDIPYEVNEIQKLSPMPRNIVQYMQNVKSILKLKNSAKQRVASSHLKTKDFPQYEIVATAQKDTSGLNISTSNFKESNYTKFSGTNTQSLQNKKIGFNIPPYCIKTDNLSFIYPAINYTSIQYDYLKLTQNSLPNPKPPVLLENFKKHGVHHPDKITEPDSTANGTCNM